MRLNKGRRLGFKVYVSFLQSYITIPKLIILFCQNVILGENDDGGKIWKTTIETS